MKKTVLLLFLAAAFATGATVVHAATCDQYPGDTWIYGGMTSRINPNVLIIIDTSGSMSDSVREKGRAYDPIDIYEETLTCKDNKGDKTCYTNMVYFLKNKKWEETGLDISQITSSCSGLNPQQLLSESGKYTGTTLSSNGSCAGGTGTENYAIGNWINWEARNIIVDNHLESKISIARNVVRHFVHKSEKINLGVMIYNNGDGTTQQSHGARFFSYSVGGQNYGTTIKDMNANFNDSTTNRLALMNAINATTVFAKGYTPLAESLYEAGQYFKGSTSAFGNTVGLSSTPLDSTLRYTSPITASCQPNYIIFVTDGMSTSDNSAVLKSFCPTNRPGCNGDFDGDGVEPNDMSHSMDDVAKYLYDTDILTDVNDIGKEHTTGKQNVSTYTIGFDLGGSNAAAVELLKRTADNQHGHGTAYLASNQAELSEALGKISATFKSVDTSYVAPVVPISPDNRTYSSNRIYMGFFKPVNQGLWIGNLKKYGLGTKKNTDNKDVSNIIIDKNGIDSAVWTDLDNNGNDDFSGADLPVGVSNGTFKDTSISHWSTSADGGIVDKGGAGSLLDPASRKLYTYTGTSLDLTNAANDFTNISAARLGVADGELNQLVKYVQGMDAYGDISQKRAWIMGDVLHSRPAAVNYGTYTAAKEGDCTVNNNMLYVGGNDGMLHAIRDCNGSEAWTFIPPDMLPNLKELPGKVHTYGVDATPSVYVYDSNNDGTIDKSTDKVILLLGMRRGGGAGSNDAGSVSAKGAYFALDVSDPLVPKYIGRIGSDTAGFSQLGESWGEPRITRIKIGDKVRIAAFIVGGYDNINEDSRYGATQSFNGSGKIDLTDSGSGAISSSGSSNQKSPKGNAIYLVELATLDGKVPSTNFAKLWSVVPGDATNYVANPATDKDLKYAFTGDVAILDTAGNGYPDRMYAADLGGNLWRFDIGGSDVSKWRGYKIFSLNPGSGGSSDTGRKFFFKPSVTLEATSSLSRGLDALVFLGSGDREHPLNKGVLDRMYALRDRGQTSPITENDMVDVTQNLLQNPNATATAVNDILSDLKKNTKYGWYIKLDERPGEKVLAPATVFNKVAYFTTYIPGSNSSSSSTSLKLEAGDKNLTVAPGLNILPRQQVIIENGANRMTGTVTAYSSNNGALTVNITSVVGKGTLTTWQVVWGDPCIPAIGTNRLYAVNYATGEAVYNFDTSNDKTVAINKRAVSQGGDGRLLRSDRSVALGAGIASGVVVTVSPGGDVKGLVGSGGNIVPLQLNKGGSIIPLYWRQK